MADTRHSMLLKKVTDAIDELFSDTSVAEEETQDDLRGIIDDCRMKISCLDADQEAEGK